MLSMHALCTRLLHMNAASCFAQIPQLQYNKTHYFIVRLLRVKCFLRPVGWLAQGANTFSYTLQNEWQLAVCLLWFPYFVTTGRLQPFIITLPVLSTSIHVCHMLCCYRKIAFPFLCFQHFLPSSPILHHLQLSFWICHLQSRFICDHSLFVQVVGLKGTGWFMDIICDNYLLVLTG